MKLNRLLLAICTSLLLFSCKNNEIEQNAELVTIKLSPTFTSLNQDTNVPMNVKGNNVKMAVNSNQVIYAIQVYENDSAYYYGLFDNIDSMKIALSTSKTYRFKIATYENGTGNGLKQVILTDNKNSYKYFYLPNRILLENKFIKGNALKDINLVSSIRLANYKGEYPEIDVHYCDKSVTITKGVTSIDFNLLRMGFGVIFNVDGLTNGRLDIYMCDDSINLTPTINKYSSVRLFKTLDGDFSSIFKNANTFSDSIPIDVEWHGTNGTTLQMVRKFLFTRNYQRIINVQLNTSNLNLNLEGWNTHTNTVPTSGLVGYWPFNGNANDESGYGGNGVVNGAALTTDRFGRMNKAYNFNGTNNFIRIDNFNSVNLGTSNFTFSCWIKAETVNNGGSAIFSKFGASSRFKTIVLSGTKGIGFDTYGKCYNVINNLISTQQWYHVVCVCLPSAKTNNFYINNVEYKLNQDPQAPLLSDQNSDVTFIGKTNNGFFFSGIIDDIRIYNRALTAQEISILYNEYTL